MTVCNVRRVNPRLLQLSLSSCFLRVRSLSARVGIGGLLAVLLGTGRGGMAPVDYERPEGHV